VGPELGRNPVPGGSPPVRDDAPAAAALMAGADGVEEDLAACAVEWHEADLVEDQDVDALEPALVAAELASVSGFEERAHEVGGAQEATWRR
jgi:hypothetical protein